MNKSSWARTVPVISTGHIPTADHVKWLLANEKTADYGEGFFIFVTSEPTLSEPHSPIGPVFAWFRERYPDEYWLCFDADGDAIDGLPFYEW